MIAAVHTTGVNWQLWAAIVATLTPVVAIIGKLLQHQIQNYTKVQTTRMDQLDVDVETIKQDAGKAREKSEVTSMSVARIEGYLAANNGGGHLLPPVPEPEPA